MRKATASQATSPSSSDIGGEQSNWGFTLPCLPEVPASAHASGAVACSAYLKLDLAPLVHAASRHMFQPCILNDAAACLCLGNSQRCRNKKEERIYQAVFVCNVRPDVGAAVAADAPPKAPRVRPAASRASPTGPGSRGPLSAEHKVQ